MQPLPVDAILGDLQAAVRGGGAAVLVAPTGSGKSTRAAPALLDVVPPDQGVLLLQPRRVAARLLAARIATERGVRLGDEVGYRVRFDHRVSPRTRLELLTEGLLTRRILDDPLLDGSGGWGRPVGAVVLDELHERSLHTDLCLALLREVRQVREDLVVVAMSATLDPGPVAAFLGATTLRAEGRSYPVDIEHQGPDLHPGDRELPHRVAAAVRDALARVPDGDVLVFLPGAPEIRRCGEALAGTLPAGTAVLPLHGRLPLAAQDRALRPADQLGLRRKIVLSTNIAETSLTLPGVRVVIDSGLARQPVLDPATGLERLHTVLVSRARADQRAGRAGRVAPGLCIRLWTALQHARRAAADPPEIERLHLAGAALSVHAWTGDPDSLSWLQPPPQAAWRQACTELASLGAIDERGITERGRGMLALPTDPPLAAVLLAARDDGQLPLACALVALIAEPDAWPAGSS
ncbi:MAG: ATP-dependent RNA helicase, partial [Deltaproteobacteria bacterium]